VTLAAERAPPLDGQDEDVLLADVATTSAAVGATSSRSAKVQLLADRLRGATPAELPVVVAYLSGELPQRRTGVGYAALRDLPPPAGVPALSVLEVHLVLERISAVAGTGSTTERRRLLGELFKAATTEEQRLLLGLLGGELRQGAQAGVVTDAVAVAAGVPIATVRSAVTLAGSLAQVAVAALTTGEAGLAAFRLQVGRPLAPMLAQPAVDLDDALTRVSRASVEWKLDGVRVQVHRAGADVQVFTRSLDDITERVPELVETALSLGAQDVVLDGEAIALRDDGRPHPFQVTASRAASRAGSVPLTPYFFDVLHADGQDLLGLPLADRLAQLDTVVPEQWRAPRLVTADVEAARVFADDALARGHEGVVVKDLQAPYESGRRGGGWLKVKPRHTLDLVVLAAEWGHGRRQGWLSNLHLGARDPDGGFVMLGKTFKGMTDELLRWQTDALLELEQSRTSYVVHVRPELVVEIAFDGVQTSPRYPGGVALRFARVLRYRPDKRADEADTIDAVRQLRL
jgi:ATP-dependent DNA ligase I